MADNQEAAPDDDYMGDLSRFLPPDSIANPPPSQKGKILSSQPSKPKRPPSRSWQEQRRMDRERKQREEDERTLASIETAIPESNVGFKLLQQMGYRPGTGLGRGGVGRADPVGLEIRRSRAGLGREDPEKEKERKELAQMERKREREEDLRAEFGLRQRSQWRVRRVVADFRKAEAALAQLENKEEVEKVEDENEEEGEEKGGNDEEEEEEIITEEDLLEILMKLRDEHQYCLYCGCQYESMEALSADCPGPNENDH